MKFYTYVYLDPRKPGQYTYKNYISFIYEPFYVGYGGDPTRYLVHIWDAQKLIKENKSKKWIRNNYYNHHKINKIIKILNLGIEPIIIKVLINVDKQVAEDYEIELIDKIGRYSLGLGPLTNLTRGGTGTSGYKWTEEQLRNRQLFLWETPEGEIIRKNSSIRGKLVFGENSSSYGNSHTDETKNKMREKKLGEKNPNFGREHSQEEKDNRVKTRMQNTNGTWYHISKEKLSNILSTSGLKRFEDPIEKFKQSERTKISSKNRWIQRKKELTIIKNQVVQYLNNSKLFYIDKYNDYVSINDKLKYTITDTALVCNIYTKFGWLKIWNTRYTNIRIIDNKMLFNRKIKPSYFINKNKILNYLGSKYEFQEVISNGNNSYFLTKNHRIMYSISPASLCCKFRTLDNKWIKQWNISYKDLKIVDDELFSNKLPYTQEYLEFKNECMNANKFIVKVLKGEEHPCYGKKQSKETCEKKRIGMLGKNKGKIPWNKKST